MGVVMLAGRAKVDGGMSLTTQLGPGIMMVESKGMAAKHS